MWTLCTGLALATPSFDPTTPDARLEGQQTWTQTGEIRLWNAIERWSDPDTELFAAEAFNTATGWKDAEPSPWIATSFGTPTPPSSTFLLHVGIHEPSAEGTPILMVPGAGDNGSRGFVTLATHMDKLNRPVFALTFAHPHGDVWMQAEVVADAVAAITARTGAAQVDLVGHSKGGLAVAAYLANHAGADFGPDAYRAVGTAYRGDVRRAVFVATPLGGVDTSFRWAGLNLYALDPDQAISPTSWDRYWPNGLLLPYDDLIDQDFLPDGRDLFPGQRQVLRRQDHPLPGSLSWLGLYALQPDWYTTYEGGTGFVSRSDGIDAAIEAGGSFIDALATVGLDPSVEVYQVAGSNPLLPNGDDTLANQFDQLGDLVDYPELLSDLGAHGVEIDADADELDALERGTLVLGEITGRADGVVFVDSATQTTPITARGGAVAEVLVADLSHLDLLYASPITGQLLIDAADAGGPDEQWMRPVGERYAAADTIGWIDRVLADSTGDSTGEPPPTDTGGAGGVPPELEFDRPCGSCSAAPGAGWLAWLIAPWAARRRR
ncbi:MAG: hypothetical protein ABMA64_18000 [Myxococcota bacterium]